jgi:hypothetical protein
MSFLYCFERLALILEAAVSFTRVVAVSIGGLNEALRLIDIFFPFHLL